MNTITHSKLCSILTLIFLLVLTAGCGPNPEQIATQTASAQTAVAALWTPTFTATATATDLPTSTPTATPTLTPTNTAIPSATPKPTEAAITGSSYTVRDVTFSFLPPEGWEQINDPERLIFRAPTTDGSQIIISFSVDQYSLFGEVMDADEVGIALFSAHVQDTIIEMIQNYDQISEDFLSTPESEPYFRWEMAHNTNGNALHQMIYIFGSKQSFLTIMYGRPMTSGEEYDRLVDDAINTLVFEE